MAKNDKELDLLNMPSLMAGNAGFEAVQRLVTSLPNPLGEMNVKDVPTKLSRGELNQLLGK